VKKMIVFDATTFFLSNAYQAKGIHLSAGACQIKYCLEPYRADAL
jgi:hypothetical protein